MKFRFAAIEREYGSAGTAVARALAEACGMPCYGQEILEEVSRIHNIPIEQIERYEEKATNSLLYSLSLTGHASAAAPYIPSSEERVYLAEQKVILQFAERGPGIFLGHCAAEALREKEGLLRVFIRGESADKKARVIRDYGIREADAASVMRRFDRKRANYYEANTGRGWSDPKSYDLTLSSSGLGVDGCVAVLRSLLGR